MKRRQRVMLSLAVLALVAPTSLMAQTSTTQTAPAQAASPLDPLAQVCENDPSPDKRIVTLDYVATGGTPFCVAISAEN